MVSNSLQPRGLQYTGPSASTVSQFGQICVYWVNACSASSIILDFLQPHGPKSTRHLCPWDFPGKNAGVGCRTLLQGILPTWDEAHSSYTAHSFFTGESPRKPHPLSRWCYLTNSSSATLFFCLHSFPASGSFPMSWLFTSGGQIIGVSLSASILPNSIQGWFLLELTSWISLKLGLSKVCSSFTIQKHQIFGILPSSWSHLNMTAGKTIALAIWTFVDIMMSLLFNTLPRFVTVFLSRNKHLLISWLQSPSTVNLDPKKIKSVTASTFSHSVCHEVMGQNVIILLLLLFRLTFKPAFSLFSFILLKRFFNSCSLSTIRIMSSAYLSLLIFLPTILIPAWVSSSPAFYMIYPAYNLNKGDNIQPWCSSFLSLNHLFHVWF